MALEAEGAHSPEADAERCRQLAGKYMTFKLAGEEYGLEILKVREIIGLMQITPAPRMPPYVRGIINLRGKVIPVVDLRVALDMERAEDSEQSVIIVVQCTVGHLALTLGVLVDEVLEVLSIDGTQIEPPPSLTGASNLQFVLGIGKVERRVIFLIDIGQILPSEGMSEVGSALAN